MPNQIIIIVVSIKYTEDWQIILEEHSKIKIIDNWVKEYNAWLEHLETKGIQYRANHANACYTSVSEEAREEKDVPGLMYEEDTVIYLIAEEGYIQNEESSSFDEPFPYEY
jgi:hypothetical protein